jgi:hypothetical protein
LRDGRLAACGLTYFAERLNKRFGTNFENKENDSIDIYQAKNIKDILKFLSQPISFCRYCKVRNWEVKVPWGVSRKELHEWVD